MAGRRKKIIEVASYFDIPRQRWGEKHAKLSAALGRLLDDYSLVKFFPLDITSEENVVDLLTVVGIFE